MKQSFGVALRQEDVVYAVKFWVLLMAMCGLVLSLDLLGLMRGVRGELESWLWPVEQKIIGVKKTMIKPWEVVTEAVDRYERLARLEQQLAAAAVDQVKLKQLEAESAFLEQGQSGATSLAEMYQREEVLVVGAGEINGIFPGMAVTDKNRVLVGRIEAVGRYISRVERVGAMEFRIPAESLSGQAKGVVLFDGTKVTFAEVLQTETLTVGEVVVTSGVEEGLPAGLVIGQVAAIESNPSDVTKKGVLDLLASDEGWVAIW